MGVNVFQVTRKIQDNVFLKPPQGALACLLLVFESWPFPKIPPKNLEARDENKIPMWEDAEVRKAGFFFCRGLWKDRFFLAVRPSSWLLLSRLPWPTRSRPCVSLTLPLGPTSDVGVSGATVVQNRGLFGEAPSTSTGGNPAAGFGTTTTALQGCNMKLQDPMLGSVLVRHCWACQCWQSVMSCERPASMLLGDVGKFKVHGFASTDDSKLNNCWVARRFGTTNDLFGS